MLKSLNPTVKFATGVQLSVAVAIPVPAGVLSASQCIVTFGGHIITGLVISCTLIVCIHSLKLPEISVACHVLDIV